MNRKHVWALICVFITLCYTRCYGSVVPAASIQKVSNTDSIVMHKAIATFGFDGRIGSILHGEVFKAINATGEVEEIALTRDINEVNRCAVALGFISRISLLTGNNDFYKYVQACVDSAVRSNKRFKLFLLAETDDSWTELSTLRNNVQSIVNNSFVTTTEDDTQRPIEVSVVPLLRSNEIWYSALGAANAELNAALPLLESAVNADLVSFNPSTAVFKYGDVQNRRIDNSVNCSNFKSTTSKMEKWVGPIHTAGTMRQFFLQAPSRYLKRLVWDRIAIGRIKNRQRISYDGKKKLFGWMRFWSENSGINSKTTKDNRKVEPNIDLIAANGQAYQNEVHYQNDLNLLLRERDSAYTCANFFYSSFEGELRKQLARTNIGRFSGQNISEISRLLPVSDTRDTTTLSNILNVSSKWILAVREAIVNVTSQHYHAYEAQFRVYIGTAAMQAAAVRAHVAVGNLLLPIYRNALETIIQSYLIAFQHQVANLSGGAPQLPRQLKALAKDKVTSFSVVVQQLQRDIIDTQFDRGATIEKYGLLSSQALASDGYNAARWVPSSSTSAHFSNGINSSRKSGNSSGTTRGATSIEFQQSVPRLSAAFEQQRLHQLLDQYSQQFIAAKTLEGDFNPYIRTSTLPPTHINVNYMVDPRTLTFSSNYDTLYDTHRNGACENRADPLRISGIAHIPFDPNLHPVSTEPEEPWWKLVINFFTKD